jgi:hypothetical protein
MPKTLTPVTLESFNVWKRTRMEKKAKELEQSTKQREAAIKAGKSIGASGRELFTFNPDMFIGMDDDDEAMEIDYTQREASDDEGGQDAAIDESLFAEEDLEGLDINDANEE